MDHAYTYFFFGWIVGRSDRGLRRHSYCLALAALADRWDGVNSCCWAALVNLNLIVVGDRSDMNQT